MNHISSSKAIYYPSLDGLRAVAIALVLVAHAEFKFPKSGWVGVDVFFCLSGFLITSILTSELRSNNKISLLNFYARRFLRLMPCLIGCVLLWLAINWFSEIKTTAPQILTILTYTTNWVRAFSMFDLGSMSHCWSLAIEEQFYLIWPFVLIILHQRKLLVGLTFQSLFLIAIGLCLYRIILAESVPPPRIYFGFDTHADGLIFGAAASLFVEKYRNLNVLPVKFLSWIVTPIAGIMILFLGIFSSWANPHILRFGFPLVSVATVIVIIDITCSKHSLIRKPLENSLARWIGKISYGLYLYHYPIYHFVDDLASDQTNLFKFFIKIGLTTVICALSYRFIEKPFLILKSKFDTKSISSSASDVRNS